MKQNNVCGKLNAVFKDMTDGKGVRHILDGIQNFLNNVTNVITTLCQGCEHCIT